MKKFLLLSVLGLSMSFAANAQVDVTPKNYHFNQIETNDLSETGILCPQYRTSAGAWNLQVWPWVTALNDSQKPYGEFFNDGLIVWSQPSLNDEVVAELKASSQLVNLGGEVGKVFCYSAMGSKINDAMKEKYGDAAPAIRSLETNGGMDQLLWFFFMDAETCPTKSKGHVHMKMTYNVYANECTEATNVSRNYYFNAEDNVVRPQGDENNGNTITGTITTALEEGEDEWGDPVTVRVWDPNLWCVEEWDFDVPEADDSHSYAPAKLKLQLDTAGFTLFIRDITMTLEDGAWEGGAAKHQRSFVTLKADPANTGNAVEAVAADNVAPVYYNLQGQQISNPATGVVIVKKGNNVTKQIIK